MNLKSLRNEAQRQHDLVQNMNFLDALKDVDGYNQFRRIYERPGDLGDYLYPSDRNSERLDLYREFSHKADVLFRKMMEAFQLNVDEVSQEDRDNLFRDAWNRGHSCGFNEIWNYYQEGVDMYDKMVSNEITSDEFEDYLDI